MNGTVYVKAPQQYEPVMARAVSNDLEIPSGKTIVQGIYYMYNERGFTGQGWMYEVDGGPTKMYPGFESNEDVAAYVADVENLDAVFLHWSSMYTLDGWDAFYTAVGKDSGCMDVAGQ